MNYFNFKKIVESTKATIRRHKAGVLTPEQRKKFIERQEDKIAKIDKEGTLSARASQIRDTIKAVSEACWEGYKAKGTKLKGGKQVPNCVPVQEASPAWQRSEGKNPKGGLNKKGVESYRRENPGSKLQTAVTTKPSKLKPGSKSAKRRKSFCSRMKGMKAKLTSAETARDPNSRINKSLRKWNC